MAQKEKKAKPQVTNSNNTLATSKVILENTNRSNYAGGQRANFAMRSRTTRMLLLSTFLLLFMFGFVAMAQDPDCENVCRNGVWGPEKTKEVLIWNDGFCKTKLKYRERICPPDPCITEIDVVFPIEVYDCNIPGFAEYLNGNEFLLRSYAFQAYRALTDSVAANSYCNPSVFKTISFGHCVAMCSFELTYYRVNDPNETEDSFLYIHWDDCAATGCCIHTRTVYKSGTIEERSEPAYSSRCPNFPPSRVNCTNAIDRYQNKIDSGEPYSGRIFTNIKESYDYPCDASCW